MPLVAYNDLPTFKRLEAEGRPVIPKGRALEQDIRELHIGLLNIMPDAALQATERQFFRLVSESNRIAQIYLYPFTLPLFDRNKAASDHIETFYLSFDQIRAQGLDALIVTGASEESNPDIVSEDVWGPLRDALTWAHDNVTSTLCSCLASHAVMTYIYDQPPIWRDTKRWGVYSHKVTDRSHPLIHGMNTKFDVPHSRYSEILPEQFRAAGLTILAESYEAGVHLAVSPDGLRQVLFQGHPEYDTVSLLKEYKREIKSFISGDRDDYPPFPEHYFGAQATEILTQYREKILAGQDSSDDFPEDRLLPLLENSWADSARSFISAWIGHVYQVTDLDRHTPFMRGVDPEDPLRIHSAQPPAGG